MDGRSGWRFRLNKRLERGNQLLLCPGLKIGRRVCVREEHAQQVAGPQSEVGQLRRDPHFPVARRFEDLLHPMCETREAFEAHHRTRTLERVDGPEYAVNDFSIRRIRFQLEQGGIDLVEQVRGFDLKRGA